MKANSIFAWTKTFPPKTPCLRVSAMIRPPPTFPAALRDSPNKARLQAIKALSTTRETQLISETHLFSPNTVNQMSAGFNRIFDYITSQGTGSCLSQAFGIPGANLGGGSCGLTSVEMPGGSYWSLGDRGYYAVRRRYECVDVLRLARYGARQARHSRRRLPSRKSVEHRCGWVPEWLLGDHRRLDR